MTPGTGGPLAVWFDGRLCDPAEPVFSASERGLLFGDGLFESLPVHEGKALDSARHLDRLSWSAHELGLPGLPPELWERGLAACLEAAGPAATILRVTWTRGIARGRGFAPSPSDGPPSLLVAAYGTEPAFEAKLREGVRVRMVRGLVPGDLAHHKTLSSLLYVVASQRAHEAEQGDAVAVLVDARDRVLEAAGWNVFVVRNERARTPPASLPILAGIGRARVRAWLGPDHCVEEPIEAYELSGAGEAFLTNAIFGVVPIVAVDGHPLGKGSAGSVTRGLIERWQAWRLSAPKARYHPPGA